MKSKLLLAMLASVAACSRPAPAPGPVATPATRAAPRLPLDAETDFGPAMGPPIPAVLTDAPEVPPALHRSAPAHVVVTIDVKEVVGRIADGVEYTFWTFGGHVPGKFIRVRQGDTVELHLRNDPGNKMPHNIDLHAVSGPGGGAVSTFTAPGHESTFTFKALNPGLFVYHCAAPPVGMHIANGMYGLILVEPREGLPPADREFYVMQGDFYTQGAYHEPGLQAFDMQKAIDERPTYVLFNGSEGSLTGANALQAKAGERIRIFVGNGGPNLVSSFHVIGAIFDRVYTEGGAHFQEQVGTTLIPSGGAAIVEFKVRVPGDYSLVDHSIFRAFNQGAIGTLHVTGLDDRWIYSGKQADTAIVQPTEVALQAVPAPKPGFAAHDPMVTGKQVFSSLCATCHQANAQGLPGAFPPLAGSDFLMADKKRAIGIVLHGLNGPVTVNGKTFNNVMPPQGQLTDQEIASVLTYVRNSFGNHGEGVKPAEVTRIRRAGNSVADR